MVAGVGVGWFWRAYPGCLHGPDSNGLLPSTTDAWARRGNPCAEAVAKAVGPPPPPASSILTARSGQPRHQSVVSQSGPLWDTPLALSQESDSLSLIP
jgi:hypothetical protein